MAGRHIHMGAAAAQIVQSCTFAVGIISTVQLLLLQMLVDLGRSKSGRKSIAEAMKLCPTVHLDSMSSVLQLRGWLASAW